MKKIVLVAAAAGLMTLAACGEKKTEVTNTVTENETVVVDNAVALDNGAVVETNTTVETTTNTVEGNAM